MPHVRSTAWPVRRAFTIRGSTAPTVVSGSGLSPGGGGGSTGRVQIYTPAGVAPSVSATAILEPTLESSRTVTLR